jgi:hypothetical protein
MSRRFRIRNATELGLDLAQVVDPRSDGFRLLAGCRPWEAYDHHLAYLDLGACPICGGVPTRGVEYCLGCDQSGIDGLVELPGYAIDEAPNEDYPATSTTYEPDPELAGGLDG